ncbi:hypothetical protein GC197_12335 [bacterium]|nr:hypothetical protein [bacterium]
MEIDLETAVEQFLELAQSYQESSLKASEILQEVAASFRNVRISGADPEKDQDMLLLEWGRGAQFALDQPTDLRQSDDEDLESIEILYLGFTRQLCAGDDEEFDDAAIQMRLICVYQSESSDAEVTSGNLWISDPSRLEYDLKKYASQPFVAEWIDQSCTRSIALVDCCG